MRKRVLGIALIAGILLSFAGYAAANVNSFNVQIPKLTSPEVGKSYSLGNFFVPFQSNITDKLSGDRVYKWELSSGTLPRGLSVTMVNSTDHGSNATANTYSKVGLITGTPNPTPAITVPTSTGPLKLKAYAQFRKDTDDGTLINLTAETQPFQLVMIPAQQVNTLTTTAPGTYNVGDKIDKKILAEVQGYTVPSFDVTIKKGTANITGWSPNAKTLDIGENKVDGYNFSLIVSPDYKAYKNYILISSDQLQAGTKDGLVIGITAKNPTDSKIKSQTKSVTLKINDTAPVISFKNKAGNADATVPSTLNIGDSIDIRVEVTGNPLPYSIEFDSKAATSLANLGISLKGISRDTAPNKIYGTTGKLIAYISGDRIGANRPGTLNALQEAVTWSLIAKSSSDKQAQTTVSKQLTVKATEVKITGALGGRLSSDVSETKAQVGQKFGLKFQATGNPTPSEIVVYDGRTETALGDFGLVLGGASFDKEFNGTRTIYLSTDHLLKTGKATVRVVAKQTIFGREHTAEYNKELNVTGTAPTFEVTRGNAKAAGSANWTVGTNQTKGSGTAVVGDSVDIRFKVRGNPSANIIEMTTDLSEYGISMKNLQTSTDLYNGGATFGISADHLLKAGKPTFTITAENAEGTKTTYTGTLTITGNAPKFDTPAFRANGASDNTAKLSGTKITAEVGDSFDIKIKITGNPTPKEITLDTDLSDYGIRYKAPNTQDKTLSDDDYKGGAIVELSTDHVLKSGTNIPLKITATNVEGSTSYNATLTLTGKTPEVTSETFNESGTKATYDTKKHTGKASMGDSFDLKVRIYGNPTPEIENVNDLSDYGIKFIQPSKTTTPKTLSDDTYKGYAIVELSADHITKAGTIPIKFTATNDEGVYTYTGSITVEASKPKIEVTANAGPATQSGNGRTAWSNKNTATLLVGDSLDLKIEITGNPTPEEIVLTNASELEGYGIELKGEVASRDSYNGKRIAYLSADHLLKAGTPKIRFSSKNDGGTTTFEGTLTINGKAPTITFYEMPSAKTLEWKNVNNTTNAIGSSTGTITATAKIGDSFDLWIVAEGNPTPTELTVASGLNTYGIELRDGPSSDDSNANNGTYNGRRTVYISGDHLLKAGTASIKVTAKNDISSVTRQADVTITGEAPVITFERVPNISTQWKNITAKSPTTVTGTANVGESFDLKVIVTGNPTPAELTVANGLSTYGLELIEVDPSGDLDGYHGTRIAYISGDVIEKSGVASIKITAKNDIGTVTREAAITISETEPTFVASTAKDGDYLFKSTAMGTKESWKIGTTKSYDIVFYGNPTPEAPTLDNEATWNSYGVYLYKQASSLDNGIEYKGYSRAVLSVDPQKVTAAAGLKLKISAKNANNKTGTKEITAVITGQKPAISGDVYYTHAEDPESTVLATLLPEIASHNTTLPNGVVGDLYTHEGVYGLEEAYGVAFIATGSLPITITATGIPAGLTGKQISGDNGTGIGLALYAITGTPTKADESGASIAITAKNDVGSVSKTYKVKIYTPAAIDTAKTTSALKQVTWGTPYTATLVGEGSKNHLTWKASWVNDNGATVVSGDDAFLRGISFDAKNFTLKGTPKISLGDDATKTFNLRVIISNDMGSDDQTFPVVVKGVKPAFTNKNPTDKQLTAYVNKPYSIDIWNDDYISSSNTVTWAATGLPDGLSMGETTGQITGTPTALTAPAGVNVRITATNVNGNATKQIKLIVTGEKPKIAQSTMAPNPNRDSLTGRTDYENGIVESNVTGNASSTNRGRTDPELVNTTADNSSGTYIAKATIKAIAGKMEYTTESPFLLIEAVSGDAPLTWTAKGLPSGLSITPSNDPDDQVAYVVGTITKDGTFNYEISATNKTLKADSNKLTGTVSVQGKPEVTTNKLGAVTTGKKFTWKFAGKGTDLKDWEVWYDRNAVSLDLEEPSTNSGASYTVTGTIDKMPVSGTTFTVYAKVENDIGGESDTAEITVDVKGVAPKLATKALPIGKVGSTYSQLIEASGTYPITITGEIAAKDATKLGISSLADLGLEVVQPVEVADSDGNPISTMADRGRAVLRSKLTSDDSGNDVSTPLKMMGNNIPITFTITNGVSTKAVTKSLKLSITGNDPKFVDATTFTKGVTAGEKLGDLTTNADTGSQSVTLPGENEGETTTAGTISFDYTGDLPLTVTVAGLPKDNSISYLLTSRDVTDDNENTTTIHTIAFYGTAPAKEGKTTAKITITNPSTKKKATKTAVLQTKVAPTITAPKLKNVTLGKKYSAKFAAKGSKTITWRIASADYLATLAEAGVTTTSYTTSEILSESGLTLSSAGALTGTVNNYPTFTKAEDYELDAGVVKFLVLATNDAGVASADAQFSVVAGKPKVTVKKLNDATVGTEYYSQALTATGAGPFTWEITDDGNTGFEVVAVDSEGAVVDEPVDEYTGEVNEAVDHWAIHGTPRASVKKGTIQVSAFDVTGAEATGKLSIVINDVAPTFPEGTINLGTIAQNETDGVTITAHLLTGTGNYNWAVKSPGKGVTAKITDASKGKAVPAANGVEITLTSKKAAAGERTFTITVTNTNNSKLKATANLSITVADDPDAASEVTDDGFGTYTAPEGLSDNSTTPKEVSETPEKVEDVTTTPEEMTEGEITLGVERTAAGLTSTEEAALEGYVIAAILPEITVTESGQYDLEVDLDEAAPTGAKLYWFAFPRTAAPTEDDEIIDIYDEAGAETDSVPESHTVVISPWFREGVTYAPVLAVKVEVTDEEVKTDAEEAKAGDVVTPDALESAE